MFLGEDKKNWMNRECNETWKTDLEVQTSEGTEIKIKRIHSKKYLLKLKKILDWKGTLSTKQVNVMARTTWWSFGIQEQCK